MDGREGCTGRGVMVSGREGERRPGDRGGSGTPTPAQRGWGNPALERGSRGTAPSASAPGDGRRRGCGSVRRRRRRGGGGGVRCSAYYVDRPPPLGALRGGG